MEATVLGIPSVAISFNGPNFESIEGWGESLRRLLPLLVRPDALPAATLLNVNLPDIPPEEVKGVRVTSLGERRYSDSLTRAQDPSGREYFWIGGGSSHWRGGEDSDFRAVDEGFVSVTPLHLDLTNYDLMEEIRTWNLDL